MGCACHGKAVPKAKKEATPKETARDSKSVAATERTKRVRTSQG